MIQASIEYHKHINNMLEKDRPGVTTGRQNKHPS
jgi:hypothetical protein